MRDVPSVKNVKVMSCIHSGLIKSKGNTEGRHVREAGVFFVRYGEKISRFCRQLCDKNGWLLLIGITVVRKRNFGLSTDRRQRERSLHEAGRLFQPDKLSLKSFSMATLPSSLR
jgi:hypothetical protein